MKALILIHFSREKSRNYYLNALKQYIDFKIYNKQMASSKLYIS